MSGRRNQPRWSFYLLFVLLVFLCIFSVVQIVRDLSATAHIQQVNEQVQEYRPDDEATKSTDAQSAGSNDSSVGSAEAQSPAASSDETVTQPQEESNPQDAGSQVEVVYDSPEVIPLTTEAPANSIPENSSDSGMEADDASSAEAERQPEADSNPDEYYTPIPVRVYQQVSGAIRKDMVDLLEANENVAGWLRISEVVDLPVMYSAAGNFYETHDFYGNESVGGALFLDTMHPLQEEVQHLVIHGHNMKDGTMFGHLVHYEQEEYFKKHPTITWITPWRMEFYDIFAVAIVSTDPAAEKYLNYLNPITFSGEAALLDWLEQLRACSVRWREMSITMDDALLTLSTCVGEDRLLVVARRINY